METLFSILWCMPPSPLASLGLRTAIKVSISCSVQFISESYMSALKKEITGYVLHLQLK